MYKLDFDINDNALLECYLLICKFHEKEIVSKNKTLLESAKISEKNLTLMDLNPLPEEKFLVGDQAVKKAQLEISLDNKNLRYIKRQNQC